MCFVTPAYTRSYYMRFDRLLAKSYPDFASVELGGVLTSSTVSTSPCCPLFPPSWRPSRPLLHFVWNGSMYVSDSVNHLPLDIFDPCISEIHITVSHLTSISVNFLSSFLICLHVFSSCSDDSSAIGSRKWNSVGSCGRSSRRIKVL